MVFLGGIKNNYDNDRRELLFFVVIFVSVLLKFYFVESCISSLMTRDVVSIASSAGVILMIFVPVSLLWSRVRPFPAILADLSLSALAVTDILYMRYYSDLFSFANVGLTAQVGDVADSVFALLCPWDVLYFADIPLLVLYVLATRYFYDTPFFKKIGLRRAVVSFILFLSGALMLWLRIDSYENKVPRVLMSMWDRPAVCSNVGALTYHVADAWNVVKGDLMRKEVPLSEISEIREWLEARRSDGMRNGRMFGAARGKNLIIIQVESLQQFVIGLKINGHEVTPNINRFAARSVYFDRTYNQTGTGNSSDAEFLVNASLYPSPAGVVYTRFAGNRYEALPKLLAEHGYSTLALHGDKPGFWNRNHMYPALGFTKFISKKDFTVDEEIGLGLSDKSFFRQSAEVLDREEKPFYAFLVTLTSHYPYNFKPMFDQTDLDVGKFKGMLIGDYLTAIHYFDTQFGSFINDLEKRGLMDSSVIVVYGDHPAIPAWDRANLEKLLGRSLKSDLAWREVQKIPLIIKIPGRDMVFKDRKTPVGLIDVPVTVSNLLGFNFVVGFGYDLFLPRAAEPVIFRNCSYMTGDVFVEPQKKSAVNVRNHRKLEYGGFENLTGEVKRRLGYSDKILEHDLVLKLLDRGVR